MPSPVLVTGGTGRLGRRVVLRLRDAGWELRVLTRGRRQATDGVQFLVGDLRASHRRRWLLPIRIPSGGRWRVLVVAAGRRPARRGFPWEQFLTATLQPQDGSLDTPEVPEGPLGAWFPERGADWPLRPDCSYSKVGGGSCRQLRPL
jgi:NAD(P)-dependent dehydrogenase (short-subunit alcohol dehydrogenase family)